MRKQTINKHFTWRQAFSALLLLSFSIIESTASELKTIERCAIEFRSGMALVEMFENDVPVERIAAIIMTGVEGKQSIESFYGSMRTLGKQNTLFLLNHQYIECNALASDIEKIDVEKHGKCITGFINNNMIVRALYTGISDIELKTMYPHLGSNIENISFWIKSFNITTALVVVFNIYDKCTDGWPLGQYNIRSIFRNYD